MLRAVAFLLLVIQQTLSSKPWESLKFGYLKRRLSEIESSHLLFQDKVSVKDVFFDHLVFDALVYDSK